MVHCAKKRRKGEKNLHFASQISKYKKVCLVKDFGSLCTQTILSENGEYNIFWHQGYDPNTPKNNSKIGFNP